MLQLAPQTKTENVSRAADTTMLLSFQFDTSCDHNGLEIIDDSITLYLNL